MFNFNDPQRNTFIIYLIMFILYILFIMGR